MSENTDWARVSSELDAQGHAAGIIFHAAA